MVGFSVERLRFIQGPAAGPVNLGQAVEEGLSRTPKSLPCCFFYDAVGSELFEAICELPEYYPTRTELGILQTSAPEILQAAGKDLTLVELGSGSATKTRILIEALLGRQERLLYVPIDISGEFLRVSSSRLSQDYLRLWVTAIADEYRAGLDELPEKAGPRLILFLGSNIGNFETEEAIRFLADLRARMRDEDRLLVGIDLVKDRRVLEAAYDDSAGVTAQFNKNILARIDRELGADFNLNAFDHWAPWIEDKSRIEMHLISRESQSVRVRALDREFAFSKGETIHTENSHKYKPDGFRAMAENAGLATLQAWSDPKGWFSVVLMRAAG